MRIPSWTIAAALTAGLALGMQAGCVMPLTPRPLVKPARRNTISVRQMAYRLNLNLESITPTAATLRNGKAVVMIFADPAGDVYINGKALPKSGPIQPRGDELEISLETARALISALAVIDKTVVPEPTNNGYAALPPAHLGSVVLDAGHGGKDTGTDAAVKNFGMSLYEKDVNLKITLATARLLSRRGVTVHMTRVQDTTVSLDRRVAISNRLRPRLFVSIHANMLADSSFRGFMVFITPSASSRSVRAAGIMVRHMATTGLVNRGIRRNNLRVVTNTKAPAILVETAFLSNRQDARFLASPAGRAKVAGAIADAIVEYLRQY